MALKHAIRLSIWRKQKETPGVEKAPGVSSPQRKGYGELRFGVRPGHPRKAVTSISQAEALAHGLTHLHHLVFAAVLARELDWCAALQDAREDARPWASSASDFVAMFGSRFVVTTIGLRFCNASR